MDALSLNLLIAAVSVALIHTALGPDHYLPFVMIARARRWTMRRTLAVTAVCGLGHVASSLLLGGLGVGLGLAIGELENVEGGRGGAAAWALVGLGLAYALWGVRKARVRQRGLELHRHGDHVHLHEGGDRSHDHRHVHGPDATFWALFAVFVLGPCEPLIPLFVVPVSEGRWGLATATGIAFGAVTVGTMLAITGMLYAGYARLPLGPLARWSHALAGSVIAASGLGMVFLGW